MTTSSSVRFGMLFLSTLVAPRGVRAQQADLRLSATRGVAVAGAPTTALAPSLAIGGSWWRLTSEISASSPERSTRLGATASAAALGPRIGPLRTELAADLLNASAYAPGDARIAARVHLAGPSRGLWLGLGAARTAQKRALLGSLGGWMQGRLGSLSLRLDQTMGGGRPGGLSYVDTTGGDTPVLVNRPATPPIRTESAMARFVTSTGRLELSLGASRTNGTTALARRSGTALATWWVDRTIALSGGFGSPLGGGFVPMKGSVRFGVLWRPFKAMPRVFTLLESSGAHGAEMERVGRDSWRLRLPANGARDVEVEGTFNDWEPVALQESEPGWWTVTLSLPPGRHELIWRHDQGAWRALPGLPSLHDDLLGDVTVLVIEPE